MDGIVEVKKQDYCYGWPVIAPRYQQNEQGALDEAVDQLGGSINTSAFSASASSLKANFQS
jgi:hypothetical protein